MTEPRRTYHGAPSARHHHGVHMHRLPDLTRSGTVELECSSVKFARVKGSIYRNWDLELRHQERGELGILPDCARGLRKLLLASMCNLPGLERPVVISLHQEMTVDIELAVGGDVAEQVVVGHNATLRWLRMTASSDRLEMRWGLRVVAHRDRAPGFVEADQSTVRVTARLLSNAQVDLFTLPEDRPEEDPELPLGEVLPPEPEGQPVVAEA